MNESPVGIVLGTGLGAFADTVENAKVWLGTRPTVPLVGGRDLVITMPRQWRTSAKIEVQYDAPIAAPINRGDVLVLPAGTGHWNSPIVIDRMIALPEGTSRDHSTTGILDIWRLK